MKTTSGSVSYTDSDLNTVSDTLMTYSEEERQSNTINRDNAKLLFRPEFIPYHIGVVELYNLTVTEGLLYGLIRYYLGLPSDDGSKKRFWFSNEQLGKMLNCSESTINNAVSTLSKVGLIEKKTVIKQSGGTMRFISNVIIPTQEQLEKQKPTSRKIKKPSPTILKNYDSEYENSNTHSINELRANNNNINNNNINNISLVQKQILDGSEEQQMEQPIMEEKDSLHDIYSPDMEDCFGDDSEEQVETHPVPTVVKNELMSEQDFDNFWKLYPKKQGRETARIKFLKLPKSELNHILQSLSEFKKSDQWNKDGGQFIPMGSTWVNQKRWKDTVIVDELEPDWDKMSDQEVWEFVEKNPKMRHKWYTHGVTTREQYLERVNYFTKYILKLPDLY